MQMYGVFFFFTFFLRQDLISFYLKLSFVCIAHKVAFIYLLDILIYLAKWLPIYF